MSALSPAELRRYDRHLILPEVGRAGQEQLKASSVLLVGAGGLGSPMAMYLAAAGVGRIGLIDFDVVDESNLQRQIIHGTSTLGKPKLVSAKARLLDINPHIQVECHELALSSANALNLFKRYDVIADGTDNFQTRYLVNDACVLTGKPNVYGSIFRFEGQVSVFHYEDGPCYRCLYSEPPPPGLVPSCAEGGVLGVLPGVIGTLQATEVIKVLLDIGTPAKGRLLLYDALKMSFRELKLRRNPDCVICGDNPTQTNLIDYDLFCGIVKPSAGAPPNDEITVRELKAILDAAEDVVLIDVREPHEAEICTIPSARLIPLKTVPEELIKLDKGKRYIVHCKMGGRSRKAVDLMKEQGFTNVFNVAGGIIRWIDEIDPSQSKY